MARLAATAAALASAATAADAFVSPPAAADARAVALEVQGAAAPIVPEAAAPGGSGSSTLAAATAASALCLAAAAARPRAHQRASRAQRRAVQEMEKEAEADVEAPAAAAKPPKPTMVDGPIAVPFAGAPAYRAFIQANVPGDAGFDPLGLGAKDLATFTSMQEAEIKHARLAMLAAVGWPIAELNQPAIAASLGMRNDLTADGRVPSVLNGGLVGDPLVGIFVTIFLLVAAIIDLNKLPDSPVGYYGFDPMGLADKAPPVIGGSLPQGRKWMSEAEIKNGRLAMIAITAYAFQEFASSVPVTAETPFLFKGPF